MKESTFDKRITKNYPHLAGKEGAHIIWMYIRSEIDSSLTIRVKGNSSTVVYGNLIYSMMYEYIRNNIDMINLKLL